MRTYERGLAQPGGSRPTARLHRLPEGKRLVRGHVQAGKATYFRHPLDSGEEAEVATPVKASYLDYSRRLVQALEVMSEVERRSPRDIVRVLANPSSAVAGYEIEGFVAKLERSAEDTTKADHVAVAAQVEGRSATSKVHMELGPEAYALAVSTHGRAARVRVSGTLVRQKRRLELRDSSGFSILSSDEDDE